ncbi:MAG: hypothetical protein ACXVKO_14575 [Bacteriovorax sp.]
MNRLLILLVFLVSGCGAKILELDPQFSSYFETFMRKAQEQNYPLVESNVNLIIKSKDSISSSKDVVGTCIQQNQNGIPEIDIKSDFWNQLPDRGKEEVLFHELGHCVLKRINHRDDVDSSGSPLSIMNTYFFSSDVYVDNYNQYIFELFNQKDLLAKLSPDSLTSLTNNPNYFNSQAVSSLSVHSNVFRCSEGP